MKYYEITVPIFAHAYITVEAESEDEAIKKALDEVTLDDIDNWQSMRKMHEGNICHYDRPWEVTIDSSYE